MNNKLIVQSTVKMFSVLEHISSSETAATLSEISKHVNLSIGSTQRITETLVHLGYLAKHPKTKVFELTTKWLHLGFAVKNKLNLSSIAIPHLKNLNHVTKETVSLAVLDNNLVVYLERLHTENFIGPKGHVGMVRPVYCNSIGKVILAFQNDEDNEKIIKRIKFEKYSNKTITDKARFRHELKKIKKMGYSINDGELSSDVYAIAAPITDSSGFAIAGINVVMPMSRLTKNMETEFQSLVVETGKLISEAYLKNF